MQYSSMGPADKSANVPPRPCDGPQFLSQSTRSSFWHCHRWYRRSDCDPPMWPEPVAIRCDCLRLSSTPPSSSSCRHSLATETWSRDAGLKVWHGYRHDRNSGCSSGSSSHRRQDQSIYIGQSNRTDDAVCISSWNTQYQMKERPWATVRLVRSLLVEPTIPDDALFDRP